MSENKIQIILQQKKPVRFIVSRLLRDLKILDIFKITYRYRSVTLRLTRSALSLSLWVDKNEREDDAEFLGRVLRKNGVFVDVGAHIGHLSLLASGIVGPLGKVFAIEAHPVTYLDLIENVRLNLATNVYPANVAAGDCAGWVSFSDNVRASDQNKVVNDGGLKVLCAPLDNLLGNLKINLLKIDVEGFEKNVFLGAQTVLSNTEVLMFEAYKTHYTNYGYSFADIHELLSASGFELGLVKNERVQIISREYEPVNCVNVVAWKDRANFLEKTGLRLQD